jgi:hypothetical protein
MLKIQFEGIIIKIWAEKALFQIRSRMICVFLGSPGSGSVIYLYGSGSGNKPKNKEKP